VLSLSSALRIFLATEPADMRKGFDGLSQLVRDRIAQDPLSGHLLMSPSLPPSLGTRFLAPSRSFPATGPERRRQLDGCSLSPV
jgi:IS66 Orf2 like protein